MDKRVRAVVEQGPNYVFHLMAVAGIGFVNAYGAKYRDTVLPSDREFLRQNGQLVDFLNGRTGPLSYPLVFLLGYLNCDSVQLLSEYFELLDRCLAGDDALFTRYRAEIAAQSQWLFAIDGDWLRQALTSHAEVLRDFGAVFARNFSAYAQNVWSAELPVLQAVADRLNERLDRADTIVGWERLTGLTFRFPEYRIVLCGAMENGPQANSLGYEKNTFWHGSDFEWMVRFISHETGTHLLINEQRAVVESGRYQADVVYRAYENLCRFYNSRLLGERSPYGMPSWYEPERFEQIYGEISAADRSLAPRELLSRGIDAYLLGRGQ